MPAEMVQCPTIRSVASRQTPFTMDALLSKGGHSIAMLSSPAQDGKVSHIVPLLPKGTVVTATRNIADYVVTENGVAAFRNKSVRQRAGALIVISHPDFRHEPERAARKLFWP